jgi:glycopeptide antibiotics resistance protein
MLFAVVVFGTIEVGQLFLPTRIADPTDVLTGVSGTYAGLSLGRWVRAGLESAHGVTE